METQKICGNCGVVEGENPKFPAPDKCQCTTWTQWSLKSNRRRILIRNAQIQLGILDTLSCYSIARLDLVDDPKARRALRVLAGAAHKILTEIAPEKAPPPRGALERPCSDCEGTGLLPPVAGFISFCDCELGESLGQ